MKRASNAKPEEIQAGKIVSEGRQLFNVPNTLEGRIFKRRCHQYLNKNSNLRMVFKGRGSRKEHGNRAAIALDHSEWMALYIEPKTWVAEDSGFEVRPEDLHRYWKNAKAEGIALQKKNDELKEEVRILRQRMGKLHLQYKAKEGDLENCRQVCMELREELSLARAGATPLKAVASEALEIRGDREVSITITVGGQ